MLNFWWVRHAPVVNNLGCCYGDNEVDCDTSNIKRFIYLAKLLPGNSKAYSSTLSRAKRTFTATVKSGFKFKSYFEDERLKEQNIGKFAGMKYKELYKLTKELKVYSPHWLMNEKYIPAGGESFVNLNERVNQFLQEKILENDNENFVIFSHGGPIRSAINIALNNKQVSVGNFKIDNLKVTKITYDKGGWEIAFINK
ncbi:MAG: hypothetical protein CFH34_01724 [Alphaproteobacteria bacterium MarineAlpha9_Bin4]|nr:hypothetical protein [Pelagibacterales bacterium]PPR24668.1 MAG: hypothetical protein CFH34_01724 [Alphaproteobacteria bacterium MarineAlpha9_Bin4]|tara:strand:+ start:391 stop:984 length:594 start_codon:yes stop_codon:yes gene_type:complete